MRDKIWYMAVILTLVGFTAGLALAGVKQLTDPIIQSRLLEKKIKPSLERFFDPLELTNNPIEDRVTLDLGRDELGRRKTVDVFVGKTGGALRAVALKTAAPGYGGDVEVLTALDLAKKEILGVKTISQKETKGLGARVGDDDEAFIQQWAGLSYEHHPALAAHGGEVDAISGATITSVAFVKAVNKAIDLFDENRDKIAESGGDR